MASSTVGRLRVVLASAVLSGSAVLAAAWPGVVEADHGPNHTVVPSLAPGTTMVGALRVRCDLVRDAKRPGGWLVETSVHNPTKQPVARIPIESSLQKVSGSPMARVMPVPSVVWQQVDRVEVPAGETVVRRHRLPKDLARQLTEARRPAAKPGGGGLALQPPGSFTSFSTVVSRWQPREPAHAQAAHRADGLRMAQQAQAR